MTHLQTPSLANKVRALKAFLRWLYEEMLERNPAPKLREPLGSEARAASKSTAAHNSGRVSLRYASYFLVHKRRGKNP